MSLLIAASLAIAAASPDGLSVEIMNDFGKCVADTNPREARALLAMDFDTEDYKQRLETLATDQSRCLWPGSKLRFASVLFAGALAEAMIERSGAAGLPQRLAYDPSRPPVGARNELETMALCTVMKAPSETAGLLAAKPGTREETAAMETITPAIPDCLAKDVTLNLNRPALRALLALAAWRIVETPKGTGE